MKIPVTIMRGGTSKGIFLNMDHMPNDQALWKDFLLDIMGSPDQRQIDGLGGANSLTSKAAIIKQSEIEGVDVEYTFAQISVDHQLVDFKGNCGNISSAVGPYAIAQGFVAPTEPITTVTILNTNTQKIIKAEVEVEDGQVKTEGTYEIPGVPGTGSPIYLSFTQAEGAVTGKLFPTGRAIDMIKTSKGLIPVSIVDVANPLVFVKAEDIGLTGYELPAEYSEDTLHYLEEIRSQAAEICGFAKKEEATIKSPAVPKMTIIAPPRDYTDSSGKLRKSKEMDVAIRMMSMQKSHQALAITGAICTTASAFLEGTIVSKIVDIHSPVIRLAHPAGIMETKVDFIAGQMQGIKVMRTARMILEGYVYTKHNYQVAHQLA
ncbi:3-methylitaconate isomerase [Priestia flexa]|uniref:2-methylaconitate cis-trans isomerase PrpF family protein n=1 Tax=Priestia flexa TaxID=86664 RepID=UPI001A8F14E7|nr:PrpF domain-containing protein [Priestia flexa]MBN8433122.1 3-methylitaconate isomerase [Priestia flexa]MCA0965648.1 3-methylitaconate isomerase [Priestia flexa]